MTRKSTPPSNQKNRRWRWLALALILPLLACAGWWAATSLYHWLTFRPTGQIAFVCWTSHTNLCVINADGTGRKQISEKFVVYGPAWSPDGTRIVFSGRIPDPTTGYYGSQSSLFIINADGSGVVQLTDAHNGATPGDPDWSPDSSRIVFRLSSAEETDSGIYTIGVDGSGLTRIKEFGAEPAWSPDGSKIVFTTNLPGDISKPRRLYIMNADGSGETPLTDFGSGSADWSPDGTQIVFQCTQGNRSGICLINADGTNLTWLTDATWGDPSWSPDGQYIVYWKSDPFCLLCNMTGHLWIMKADGSQPTLLSNDGIDMSPAWRP